MLFDPKWEVQTKPDVYSLEGFVSWLEKQPTERAYDWYDVHGCIVCQYLDSVLPPDRETALLSRVFSTSDQYHQVAGKWPWTFGAALDRARKALAQ